MQMLVLRQLLLLKGCLISNVRLRANYRLWEEFFICLLLFLSLWIFWFCEIYLNFEIQLEKEGNMYSKCWTRTKYLSMMELWCHVDWSCQMCVVIWRSIWPFFELVYCTSVQVVLVPLSPNHQTITFYHLPLPFNALISSKIYILLNIIQHFVLSHSTFCCILFLSVNLTVFELVYRTSCVTYFSLS